MAGLKGLTACAIALVLPLIAAAQMPVAPRVEKDAHAEAILWEVWVSDDMSGGYPHTVMKNLLRVVAFDERGVEMLSKVDIPHLASRHISDVWARTTKKSGEVVELKKDGIFERVIAKASGVKIKTTSFALPGLEPGAIVEYGWVERQEDELANYIRLPLQREYPVQTVRYHIKPLVSPYFPYSMRAQTFHAPQTPFEKEPNGFVGLTFNNLAALREEPDMPPDNEVSGWILIYYAPDSNMTPDKYWHENGKAEYERFKQRMKVNDDIRRKANELVQGAADDREKMKRLFLYCRSSIKNVGDAAADLTPEQRNSFKENKTPGDTLKRGLGTGADIDLLFAALANAAGFEARYARAADRSQYFFNKEFANLYFLHAWQIAVKVSGKWMFFDPASTYVPFGMLRWQEEGNFTLITDNKEPELVKTEISTPEKSARRRLARFDLSEDGTIEGDIRITHSGHRVVERRREYSAMKLDERIESLKKEIESQFPGSEVSRLELGQLSDPESPLVWSYHIKIPGYAQRTGKRLFIQPAVFVRGYPARFTATDRKFPVYFHYPWLDIDHVTIHIPDGYELDNAEMPPSLPIKDVGTYNISAQYSKATRELTYKREFVFGKNFALLYPVEAYPALKQIFEIIHTNDNHTLSLKQGTPSK